MTRIIEWLKCWFGPQEVTFPPGTVIHLGNGPIVMRGRVHVRTAKP
jgi:hypothetical protein